MKNIFTSSISDSQRINPADARKLVKQGFHVLNPKVFVRRFHKLYGSSEQWTYLVGGLESATLMPEYEQRKLNELAANGWELLTVLEKNCQDGLFTFYYLRRMKRKKEQSVDKPKFFKLLNRAALPQS